MDEEKTTTTTRRNPKASLLKTARLQAMAVSMAWSETVDIYERNDDGDGDESMKREAWNAKP
jgi:hypothetical protein